MVVGSLAGIAVLYELVALANNSRLDAQLHSPTDVMIGAACLFVFGWGLALVAAHVARWFGLFVVAGAAAAGAIAASGTQRDFAAPLFCVGLAAALIVFASFRGDRQSRRARMT